MADCDEILHEYWYTEISGSYSDISQSQGTDDQIIDIMAIFIRLMMKEVLSYGTSAYNKTPYHVCPCGRDVGFGVASWSSEMNLK